MYIYKYIHKYIYTYIHIYTYKYMYMLMYVTISTQISASPKSTKYRKLRILDTNSNNSFPSDSGPKDLGRLEIPQFAKRLQARTKRRKTPKTH